MLDHPDVFFRWNMCAQGDRREFITRIRRIAADIDRSYQQASLDSLEDYGYEGKRCTSSDSFSFS